jgi:hypothetical protein
LKQWRRQHSQPQRTLPRRWRSRQGRAQARSLWQRPPLSQPRYRQGQEHRSPRGGLSGLSRTPAEPLPKAVSGVDRVAGNLIRRGSLRVASKVLGMRLGFLLRVVLVYLVI